MSTYAARAYSATHEDRLSDADPLELIRMLYRAAVDAIAKARLALASGDIGQRSAAITRASEILAELTSALDMDQGGELARRLFDLYDYIQRRLQEANFLQADEPLAESHGLLSTLLEGWEQCRPQASGPVPVRAAGSRAATAAVTA
ncbi:MAG: flagellar export chaperone FliS [Bryobacteraceae bacterium]